VCRFVAWPFWGLLLASAAVVVLQAAVDLPLSLLLGVVIMTAVVLLADPWRVAALSAVVGVIAAGVPLLDPAPLEGYWARLLWYPVLAAFAVLLASLEHRRLRAARANSRLLRGILDATDQPIFVKRYETVGAQPSYVLTNPAWAAATGVDDATGRTDADLFPQSLVEVVASADAEVLQSGRAVTVEEHVGPRAGSERPYLVTKFPLLDEEGRPWAVAGIATDLSEQRRAERRMAAVFDESPVAAVRLMLGPGGVGVLQSNEAAEQLLGMPLDGMDQAALRRFIHPDDLDQVWSGLASVAAVGGDVTSARELRLLDLRGSLHWVRVSASQVGEPDSDGSVEVVVQLADQTELRALESALTSRALTDAVTGLPNRAAVNDRLATAIARLRRSSGVVSVIFCDLDRFKQVNDVYGHQVGDLLLAEVAGRLRSALRPEDTVGRIGGDEFVVVCEGLGDPREAAVLALRMQEHLAVPWRHGDLVFTPTASIGVAVTSDPGADPVDLLRQADIAMYRAKDSGRARIETYDRSLDEELAGALAMQQRLRDALADDGFVLHYQPVVLLGSGAVVGAEALIRMKDGDGLLGPDRFLPHAEASGVIGAVGDWVVDRALADRARWEERGVRIDVGVNISPSQLSKPGFAADLLQRIAAHSTPPERVLVEITETALMVEGTASSAALEELHAAGVRIALDDFGTGYSSLSWLHRFPVDIVKIDKSFVQAMLHDHRRATVVRAVLDIADEIGLGVVAEGVETEEQAAVLRELGCEAAQGWLFGRPVPADDPAWAALAGLPRVGRSG
jgi:diguanylate cyclase (GGDEF)-like protein/PAS domain S-box-containing protein